MKARFYIHYFDGFNPRDEYRLMRVGKLIATKKSSQEMFDGYLLPSITSDFSDNRHGHLDLVIESVKGIEQGAIDAYEWEGQGFTHHISRSRVRFEHSVFGECPEWPIWCCTLAQYKAALEGYRRFLDMPESIDSELIIELPEGEP